MRTRKILFLTSIFFCVAFCAAQKRSVSVSNKKTVKKQVPRELFRGQVVLLKEALAKRGINSTVEATKQVVLESEDGQLIPIVPDWRGRAFYQDAKLRNRKVELVGMRKKNIPYLQVLSVYTFDKNGQRQYTDYWCDICSIPMYEIKKCECCQGPVHLRFQHKPLPDYIAKPKKRNHN